MEKFEIVNGNVKCHCKCGRCFIMKYSKDLISNDNLRYFITLETAVKQLVKDGKIRDDNGNTESDCAIIYRYMMKLEMEEKVRVWKELK
jgi:hypothetical protein